ncbi:MAG: hypothetical protein QGI05_03365, partial [Candidatus Omnitrophota bacterium]|nr:hypothetical protein [Candidatus Omnitrophota bacterium]
FITTTRNTIEELQDDFDVTKTLDMASTLRSDLESALDATIFVNPRELQKHLSFDDQVLNDLLYQVALDHEEMSVDADHVADLVEGFANADVSTDNMYALLEDWQQQPMNTIFETHEKNLIYGLVNALTDPGTGIAYTGALGLNSSLSTESAFKSGNFHSINSIDTGNGETFNFYNGTGILSLKTPLFGSNSNTIMTAEAVTDVLALHSVQNVIESDSVNIGVEQLYYVLGFNDDVSLSIGEGSNSSWSGLGFSQDSFGVLFKNEEEHYLPGVMNGITASHPENYFFFRARAIPYLSLDKGEDNKPILEWKAPEGDKGLLDAVDFAYDTVFGVNPKIMNREVLLSFHNDVNDNNSFLHSYEIFPSLSIGNEMQFTAEDELQNELYFMDYSLNGFKSHLFIDNGVENALYARGGSVEYDFGKFSLGMGLSQKEWENLGDTEKVEDKIALSFTKGKRLQLISNLTKNYILYKDTYFTGFNYALNRENSANLSAGIEYIDYTKRDAQLDMRVKFNFIF